MYQTSIRANELTSDHILAASSKLSNCSIFKERCALSDWPVESHSALG